MRYKGLRAIAKRMDWDRKRLMRAILNPKVGFPAYLIRGHGNRVNWVSNDDLIFAWELQECVKTRAAYRQGHRKADRWRPKGGSGELPNDYAA